MASGTRAGCSSVCAASRTSSARPQSGIRCSRLACIRMVGTVHTRPAGSISSYIASRTSLDRATAVSTRNLNASLTAGCADFESRTVSIAAATSLCDSACRCVTMSFCGPNTGSARSHGVVVVLQVHRDRPLQHRADALANPLAVSAFTCQDRSEDLQHVDRVDFRDGPATDGRCGGRRTVPCCTTSPACHRLREPAEREPPERSIRATCGYTRPSYAATTTSRDPGQRHKGVTLNLAQRDSGVEHRLDTPCRGGPRARAPQAFRQER